MIANSPRTLLHTSLFFVTVTVLPVQQLNAQDVDIRTSRLAEQLTNEFNRVAPKIGNRGSTRITRLTIDSLRGDVKGSVKFTASHSFGRIRAPTLLNPGRKVEVSKSTSAEVAFSYTLSTAEFDMETSIPLRISFNAFGKNFSKEFGSVTIDLDRLKRIFDGDINAILELIPNPVPEFFRRERRNYYEDVTRSYRDNFGKGNVYVSTEGFVNFADPQKLAVEVIKAVATDGASLKLYMKRVQSELTKEKAKILEFLKTKSQARAEEIASGLLNGQFEFQLPQLQFRFQPVFYESRFVIAGRGNTPWIGVNHLAFVIIWNEPGNADSSIDIEPSPTGGSITNQIVEATEKSSWNSTFRAPGGGQVNTRVVLNGKQGSYRNGFSQLSNIKYEPTEDQLLIHGDWRQDNQSGKFEFRVDAASPGLFSGRYNFSNQTGFPAEQIWNGTRIGNTPQQ